MFLWFDSPPFVGLRLLAVLADGVSALPIILLRSIFVFESSRTLKATTCPVSIPFRASFDSDWASRSAVFICVP